MVSAIRRQSSFANHQGGDLSLIMCMGCLLLLSMGPHIAGVLIYELLGDRTCTPNPGAAWPAPGQHPLTLWLGCMSFGGLGLHLVLYALAIAVSTLKTSDRPIFWMLVCLSWFLGFCGWCVCMYYFVRVDFDVYPFDQATFDRLRVNTSYAFPTAFPSGASLDEILQASQPICAAEWREAADDSKHRTDSLDPCDYLGQTCDDELFAATRGLAIFWLVVDVICAIAFGTGGMLIFAAGT